MNTADFLREYHDLIASNYGEDQFATLKMLCPGLSSPKLGKLLNRAVNYLKDDEYYVEIGTFVGYTLISASMHNTQTKCIGIDNFRLLGENTTETTREWARKRLKVNLDHFKYGNQMIIDSDYKKVNKVDKPIGVFFVDGDHTREEVYECLKWGHDKLSDEALVFIDDISAWNVGDGVKDWLNEKKEYREIFHMDTFYDKDLFRPEQCNNVFWHGLSILRFDRKKEDKK